MVLIYSVCMLGMRMQVMLICVVMLFIVSLLLLVCVFFVLFCGHGVTVGFVCVYDVAVAIICVVLHCRDYECCCLRWWCVF